MLFYNKIFITGFMGSGKSTLGKKLAQVLRRDFIDLDLYIEIKYQNKISKIFDQLGEAEFRKMEEECLIEIIQKKEVMVIALGGGTICFKDNLTKVKQNGLLVYLNLPAKVLAERIKKSRTIRPLLQNLKNDNLLETIEQKLHQRNEFYEQAHLKVNGLNLTAQLLQPQIIEFQTKNNS